jgi:hypothetical protein
MIDRRASMGAKPLSRCVGEMAGVHPKSAIHAYRPSRLDNGLPQRSPVLKTNRTLRVFRQKHMQIRIAYWNCSAAKPADKQAFSTETTRVTVTMAMVEGMRATGWLLIARWS